MHTRFKTLNVAIASERKMRKLAQEIVGDNVVVERVPFTFIWKMEEKKSKRFPLCMYRTLLPKWLIVLQSLRGRLFNYQLGYIIIHMHIPT